MNGTLYGMAYVNFNQAAQYCGYKPEYFRKMVKGYYIPKYGPKRNRYKLDDLNKFMEDCSTFIPSRSRDYVPTKIKKVV